MHLIPDLWDLVCQFAFHATRAEVLSTIHELENFMELGIHDSFVSELVFDYTDFPLYCRASKMPLYQLFRPYALPLVPSPTRIFFVWYDASDFVDYDHILRMCLSLDWRRFRPFTGMSRGQFIREISHNMKTLANFTHTVQALDMPLMLRPLCQ
jgi:hypothetical protein